MTASVTHLDEPTYNELVAEYARKRPKVDIEKLLTYHPLTVDELNKRFYRKFKSASVIKSPTGATLNRIISESETKAKAKR